MSSTRKTRATRATSGAESGVATIYAQKFQGRRTASGERFDVNKRTAAHGSRPFGSTVRVTNLGTGRSTCVRINDRGVRGRRIDLSPIAGRDVGLTLRIGTARVQMHSGCGR